MKVEITKDFQNQNKFLKQKIETLSTDLQTAKNIIVNLHSKQNRKNITKQNLLINQVMEKKRIKKKKLKTDTSSDASDEEDNDDINQLNQKIKILKITIRTQMAQIQQLYTQIINLQEKEEEHQERIKVFDKLDRYVKRMSKNNRKVKNIW